MPVPILASGDPIPASLLDAIAAALNPSVAYTPSWTSSGTAPAIGNGTLSGSYVLSGQMVEFRIKLIAGSTTTFGTGAWFFSVPFPRASTEYFDGAITGLTFGGTSNRFIVASQDNGTSSFSLMAAGTPASGVSATVPFTWANTHTLTLHGSYEKA